MRVIQIEEIQYKNHPHKNLDNVNRVQEVLLRKYKCLWSAKVILTSGEDVWVSARRKKDITPGSMLIVKKVKIEVFEGLVQTAPDSSVRQSKD